MFAARIRASSLKHLFHGRHSSSLTRTLISKWNPLDRAMSSWRLSRNRVEIKLLHRSFHSSPESVVGTKAYINGLLSSLEDDFFSELGSVKKDQNMVLKLLTTKPDPLQIHKAEPSQHTTSKKKKKKKKKRKTKQNCAQVSDSVSKLQLMTAKPEVSWKTKRKRKAQARALTPARNVTVSK